MSRRPDWPALLERAAAIVQSYDTLVTLRQLFYRLVAAQLLPNTTNAYKSLSRYTAEARRNGSFPALMDRGRTIHRYQTFMSAAQARSWLQQIYRRDRTEGQPHPVYLGVEKAGIVEQLREWFGDLGVPILALGGYGSQTYVDDVIHDVEQTGRPAVLLYAGDHDPSGEDIDRDFTDRTDCWEQVRRVALTADQVRFYGLPPQPGKDTDSRARSFVARHGALVQVELDALAPDILRDLLGRQFRSSGMRPPISVRSAAKRRTVVSSMVSRGRHAEVAKAGAPALQFADLVRLVAATALAGGPRRAGVIVQSHDTLVTPYCGNRDEAVEVVIDADAVATAVRAVMTTSTTWTGTTSDLQGALAEVVGERVAKIQDLAEKPSGAGGSAPPCRDVPAHNRHRDRLRARGTGTDPRHQHLHNSQPSGARRRRRATVRSVCANAKPQPRQWLRGNPLRTVSTDADGSGQGPNPTVRVNPLKTHTGTAADGADATRTGDSGAAEGVALPAVAPDDTLPEFEERAAIAEFDGGLRR